MVYIIEYQEDIVKQPNAGYVKKWVTWLSLYLLTGYESTLSSVAPISGCSVFFLGSCLTETFISGYNLQLCLTEVVMPSNKKPLYRFSFLTDSAVGRVA